MIDEVRDFLAFMSDPPAKGKLASLAKLLDRLSLAYNNTSDTHAQDINADPPDGRAYQEQYQIVARTFPEFGYYPVVDPLGDGDQERMLGDAVDDLTDIVSDLEEVTWRWENTSVEDASWCFRFGYESHWGQHLHDLRNVIYCLQFRS